MGNEIVEGNAGVMDRRTLMSRTGKLGVAAAVVGGTAATFATPASAASTTRIVLDIDTAGFADFQQVPLPGGAEGTGPFYVSGGIFIPNGANFGSKRMGVFHCWGWLRDPDALGVVNQEFRVHGRGKIQIAGVESGAPRAVTGGTADFRVARGEGFPDLAIFDFMNTGKFRIAFTLWDALGPSITP